MLFNWENEMELHHLSFEIVWNNFWFGIDVNGYICENVFLRRWNVLYEGAT